AIELRERYSGINPAYHFNKKHWNMMDLTGSVPRQLLLELIAHSYNLVIASLPRNLRAGLDPITHTDI
ncbi:MAG: MmcQ/YjbR family DNA-binding protein, partial [Muribaculaceae bacterium]|nr:MmcQ/YjbR family DNA-binding protein [Muribaculaceae bacterium]